jgi:hypothetical protein
MKIQIRRSGGRLTKIERAQLKSRLDFALARFGERIDLVIVRLSADVAVPRYVRCQLEVNVDVEVVIVEHTDIDISLAVEHAATRAARSVARAIERRSWAAEH